MLPAVWQAEPTAGTRDLIHSLAGYFAICGVTVRKRDRITFLTETIKVEFDGLFHVPFDFLLGATCRDTTGKVWRIGRKACFRLLDNNQISVHFNPATRDRPVKVMVAKGPMIQRKPLHYRIFPSNPRSLPLQNLPGPLEAGPEIIPGPPTSRCLIPEWAALPGKQHGAKAAGSLNNRSRNHFPEIRLQHPPQDHPFDPPQGQGGTTVKGIAAKAFQTSLQSSPIGAHLRP